MAMKLDECATCCTAVLVSCSRDWCGYAEAFLVHGNASLLLGVAEVFGQSSSLAGAAWSDPEHRMLKCVCEYGGAEITATRY